MFKFNKLNLTSALKSVAQTFSSVVKAYMMPKPKKLNSKLLMVTAPVKFKQNGNVLEERLKLLFHLSNGFSVMKNCLKNKRKQLVFKPLSLFHFHLPSMIKNGLKLWNISTMTLISLELLTKMLI